MFIYERITFVFEQNYYFDYDDMIVHSWLLCNDKNVIDEPSLYTLRRDGIVDEDVLDYLETILKTKLSRIDGFQSHEDWMDDSLLLILGNNRHALKNVKFRRHRNSNDDTLYDFDEIIKFDTDYSYNEFTDAIKDSSLNQIKYILGSKDPLIRALADNIRQSYALHNHIKDSLKKLNVAVDKEHWKQFGVIL